MFVPGYPLGRLVLETTRISANLGSRLKGSGRRGKCQGPILRGLGFELRV